MLYLYLSIAALFSAACYTYTPRQDGAAKAGLLGWIQAYLSSWYTAILYMTSWKKLLEMKTHDPTASGHFKIPTLHGYLTLVSSVENIEELNKTPETILSLSSAYSEVLQTEYLAPGALSNVNSESLLKAAHMTQHEVVRHEELQTVTKRQFQRDIPHKAPGEWQSLRALALTERILTRVGCQSFVGAPLCHNEEYVSLVQTFMNTLGLGSMIVGVLPQWLKCFVGRYFAGTHKGLTKAESLLVPLIEERIKILAAGGALPGPTSWKSGKASSLDIARGVFIFNAVTISEVVRSCCNVFLALSRNSTYIAALREELANIKSAGLVGPRHWTESLVLMDAFIKETLRLDGSHIAGLLRKAERDYTFSSGLTVKSGHNVAVPVDAVHRNESLYPNAERFDPTRHLLPNQDPEEASVTNAQRSPTYLSFGYGVHACPGRFLSTTCMKLALAELLENYDLESAGDMKAGSQWAVQAFMTTNEKAEIRLRKREKD
ncbi:cytochrome P450 [Geopyxis carbonaria]|nr:cytochrome P450 [Geopyxis carbonaria]